MYKEHKQNRVTLRQIQLMKHTLGLDRSVDSYRNYFFANENHIDIEDLDRLVDKELMLKYESKISTDVTYSVTDKGKERLREMGYKV